MGARVINRNGGWRKPFYLRQEVYRAWQRFEWLLDRVRSGYIQSRLGEAPRWKEKMTRYQDRVCIGDLDCHDAVSNAFDEWEDSDMAILGVNIEASKDRLISLIEEGKYMYLQPRNLISSINKIANALPYVRKPKCGD